MNSFLVTLAKFVAAPLASLLMLAGYNVQQPKIVTVPQEKTVILGNYNPSGGGTYRLKNSIGLSNTSINLSSFKEPISNIPYTMTYLNTLTAYGTLDPQTPTKSEFISFTGITQNSDGSAQLTGVTRGLSRTPGTGDCVASTTLAISHSGQSIFILSDSPCFFSNYAVKSNNESITGSWTTIEPTNSSGFATKNYVDTHVNGGTVSTDRVTVAGTAGETVSAGQVVYLKSLDSRWYKAGVSISEASTTALGIAQGSGTASVAISGGVMLTGLDTNQSGLTSGANYFLGSTAGTISSATSTRIIGQARDSTSIYVKTDIYPNPGVGLKYLGANTFASTTTFTAPITVSAATSTLATTTINGYLPAVYISSVATGTQASLSLSGIPPSDSLTIMVHASSTAATNGILLYFNGDSSPSYNYTSTYQISNSAFLSTSVNGTVTLNGTTYAQPGTGQSGRNNLNEYDFMTVSNIPTAPKFGTLETVAKYQEQPYPTASSTRFSYYNTTSRINSIVASSTGSGMLSTGSYITVIAYPVR